ncbi:hypothetical protein ABDK00_014455 [Niabella insulamsoli]|uniref:hypothetical protein n=1 Tax=Niabella insulamsoli TaxID=3144874 RepID=UPI0031FDD32E
MRFKIFLHKLLNKEYWPSFLIYFPLFPVWVYYSIKARSLLFLSAANPGIEYSGIFLERKSRIHEILPPAYTPQTILINPLQTTAAGLIELLQQASFEFPFFAKPDIGEKGTGVKKINTESDIVDYHARQKAPYLIQAFIPYEHEAGVFFIRQPNRSKGVVSGIVYKELPHVTGNGRDPVRQLAFSDIRYAMQKESIEKLSPDTLNQIPADGERVALLSYGNHARGAKFYDYSFKISPELEQTMNKVCGAIPGFYYGRLDIKFDNWEDFARGKNFAIVELNGSGADPTHIFDPSLSLISVWKIIITHWHGLYQVASYLHKHQQVPYMTVKAYFSLRKKYKAYLKTIK